MKTVVKCCIEMDGLFLVVKRSETAYMWPNCWDFPGGTQDAADESPIATLLRETKEELGTSVHPSQKLITIVWDLRDTGSPTHRIHVYSGALGADVVLSDEHSEVQWMTIEEIEKLPLDPFLRQFLHLYVHPESSV